jgi:hypothetical protein
MYVCMYVCMYVWPDHFWHTPLLELGPLVQRKQYCLFNILEPVCARHGGGQKDHTTSWECKGTHWEVPRGVTSCKSSKHNLILADDKTKMPWKRHFARIEPSGTNGAPHSLCHLATAQPYVCMYVHEPVQILSPTLSLLLSPWLALLVPLHCIPLFCMQLLSCWACHWLSSSSPAPCLPSLCHRFRIALVG